uniref:Uncharacterized protein n=1 Tax=Tanacetum cinerariifolium TaxID=118510 RepID=A0A6L2KT80_TANCI|nr:hypothetical protein [Tanacetum cinerariifolium]
MAYFMAILTPESAWFCVMYCTFPTEGMRSIISMVFISLEGFLPSILLLVVIIVVIVIVAVNLVVVVIDAIVGVVIVVASIGVVFVVMIIRIVVIVDDGVSYITKLSFVIIGLEAVTLPSMLWGSPLMKASIIFSVFGTMFGHKTANSWNLLTPGDHIGLFYSDRLSVCIPPRQGIIDQAACASKAIATPFVISCRMVASVIAGVADAHQRGVVDLTGNEDPSDEDEGTRMGDPTGVSMSLVEISLEGNKSWESNISDSDNTGDGGKIAGRAITT